MWFSCKSRPQRCIFQHKDIFPDHRDGFSNYALLAFHTPPTNLAPRTCTVYWPQKQENEAGKLSRDQGTDILFKDSCNGCLQTNILQRRRPVAWTSLIVSMRQCLIIRLLFGFASEMAMLSTVAMKRTNFYF